MESTAYAVMVIDKATLKVVGVGIFGEASPSTTFTRFTIELFSECANTYVEASAKVKKALKTDPAYDFLRPVVEWNRG